MRDISTGVNSMYNFQLNFSNFIEDSMSMNEPCCFPGDVKEMEVSGCDFSFSVTIISNISSVTEVTRNVYNINEESGINFLYLFPLKVTFYLLENSTGDSIYPYLIFFISNRKYFRSVKFNIIKKLSFII